MESLDFSTVFAWRAVERLIAVLIGGGSIYLGYRLFMALPELSADGEGKFELPGGVSIYVSRVGPGIFFALFGTALVGLAFINVLTWQPGSPASPSVAPADPPPIPGCPVRTGRPRRWPVAGRRPFPGRRHRRPWHGS